MKIFFFIIIAAILFSCSKGHEPTPNNEEYCSGEIDIEGPQVWKLVKMTGSLIDSETTGADMAWQEEILLHADGTFKKARTRDHKFTEALGIYTFEKSLGGDPAYVGLILSYASDNELIGSCQSILLRETYMLRSRCNMEGTWSMCDGPGLVYTRQVFFD